jgi:hypothetical protein
MHAANLATMSEFNLGDYPGLPPNWMKIYHILKCLPHSHPRFERFESAVERPWK